MEGTREDWQKGIRESGAREQNEKENEGVMSQSTHQIASSSPLQTLDPTGLSVRPF